ncbi:heterokaryon incompatibility protein-domain-containing protein [Fusarium oxysporum]|nr:heterokaryon incompatibility protein-domain-containing protein [Fusarium oxysporum]
MSSNIPSAMGIAITPGSQSGPRCEKCSLIDWKSHFTRPRPSQSPQFMDHDEETTVRRTFHHYDSFLKLETSADNGCQLCRVILMSLADHYTDLETWVAGTLQVNIKIWNVIEPPESNRAPEKLVDMHLTLPPPFTITIGRNRKLYKIVHVAIDFMNGAALLPREGRGSSSQVRRLAPQDLDSELDGLIKQIIQPWLNRCLKDHSECRTIPGDKNSNYPKRLIFVGNEKSDAIRLVEIDTQCPPYLILSYCWGSTNGSARTTYRNLEAHLDRIDISKMPRTVRDAIKLTRAMGKEYIWIDALCIEQAEDNHPGDWDNEASKVGDYYANAECLISAMRAGESAQGFLTERVTWRYPQRRALLAHGETRCHRQQLYFWAEGPRQSFFREKLSEPLLERGWCLQERILCPRRLHWTKNGLFWECNSALASEQEAFSNYSRFENSTTELGEVAILRDEEPTALVEDWYKITEDYSRMKLSYEKDRFAAIHGLATRLAKRHNDTYYAGIFGSRLAQGLMYQDACDSKKTPDSPICFPTWSWAAASGGALYEYA